MLSKTDVISLIYAYFYKSGAMLQWNAMMLSMTSFERKSHRPIFEDATHCSVTSVARLSLYGETVNKE